MQDLESLQRTHRLGLHVWEDTPLYTLPHDALSVLTQCRSQPELLSRPGYGTTPLLSVSLLPAPHEHTNGMYVYLADAIAPRPAYLMDLRQESANRALIPRISEKGINSGEFYHGKRFQLHIPSAIPELEMTRNAARNSPVSPDGEEHLIRQARGADGARITGAQLDALGEHMAEIQQHHPGAELAYNELLVAADNSHLKAICLPVNNIATGLTSQEQYAAFIRLSGAVAGMQHLDAGHPSLPVVLYHITENPELGGHAGTLTWLGESRDALHAIAVQAVKTLQNTFPHDAPGTAFSRAVRPLVGSDIHGDQSFFNLKDALWQQFGIDVAEPAAGHGQCKQPRQGVGLGL